MGVNLSITYIYVKEKNIPPILPICHPMYCQIGRIGGLFFLLPYNIRAREKGREQLLM